MGMYNLHRLDRLDQLWMDGRLFDSTDWLSDVRVYTPSTLLSCYRLVLQPVVFPIHFQNRQLGRTSPWLASIPVATLTARNPVWTSQGVSHPLSSRIYFTPAYSTNFPLGADNRRRLGTTSILTKHATRNLTIDCSSLFVAET